MSMLIKNQLHKLTKFADYQDGYKRITKVRKRFNLSPRSWDDLLAGSQNIPLSIYNRVYELVRYLQPSEDVDLTQTDNAIESFKNELSNGHRICVNK